MLSMGRFCVLDKEGNEIDNDPYLAKIANPNFSQSQQDFIYQHSFFKGLGNNITRVISKNKSKDIESVYAFENLIPDQIDYNEINKLNKFVFANSDKKKVQERNIKYTLGNKQYDIPLTELMFFYDVSNGLCADERFKSPSRITALLPALRNIEAAQKAKNINLDFSAKWLISGKKQGGDDQMLDEVLGSDERKEIESKISYKDLLVNPNGIDVHSLAVNFRELMYDDMIAADMLKVSLEYGMGKDVISYFSNGASTHENQKTAVVDWIQNSIQFEADDLCNTHAAYFGYLEQGKTIKMKFDHLPIMQILEEKRMASIEKKIAIANGFVALGLDQKEAMKRAGLEEL